MLITANDDQPHNHPSSSMAEDDDYDGFQNLNIMPKKLPKTSQRRSNNTTISSFPNFSSLPCFNVKWGHQKQLRCIKESNHHHQSYHNPDLPSSSRSTDNDDNGGTFQAMTDKLMLDFRARIQQMQADILKKSDFVEPRPWNLRTRRAVCKEPNGVNGANRKPSFFPVKSTENNGATGGGCEAKKRAKFSATLSKQEIEEDFLAISGTRPVRRPKKRPRLVQRQIDGLFPGLWLSEITPDMYKVNEQPETGKR